MSTTVKGYDGFVEVTRKVMQSRSPLLQRVSSMRVLHSAIPPWLLKIVIKCDFFLLIHFLYTQINYCKQFKYSPLISLNTALVTEVYATNSSKLIRNASVETLLTYSMLSEQVRRFLPNNRKTAETFAAATLNAEWLVGPCEVYLHN